MAEKEVTVQPAENACWICGSRDVSLWKDRSLGRRLTPEDFKITDSRYGLTVKLLQCSECGFIFADQKEFDSLIALYEQLEDDGYQATEHTRRLQMNWLLRKSLPGESLVGKTLLDIGAGSGLLMDEAKTLGADIWGIEPSRSLAACAESRHPGKVVRGIFPSERLCNMKFDVIFLVDVIEHVSNPVGLLTCCAEALKEGGRIVVVTPDIGSLAARTLRRRWWHLRLAHVGYFSKTTLIKCAESAGLKSTLWFRSRWFFPIEYLSERLVEYLPLRWFFSSFKRAPLVGRLFRLTVPLNLFDSWVCVLSK